MTYILEQYYFYFTMKNREETNHPLPEIVHHYHFHYFMDQDPQKSKGFSRVRSDSKIQVSRNNPDNSDNLSTSSRQSWKDLIIPAYQSNQIEKVEIVKNNTITHRSQHKLAGRLSSRSTRNNQTEKKELSHKTASKHERLSATIESNNNQQESFSIHEPSFGTSADQFGKINPENLEKSKFSKKSRLSHEGSILKWEDKESSVMEYQKKYAFGLLEEECKYLRRKFLEHYIRNHLISKGQQKKA